MSKNNQWLDNLAKQFADSIGSPWGEGATYQRGRIEAKTSDGLFLQEAINQERNRKEES